jgi:hypothetical protein
MAAERVVSEFPIVLVSWRDANAQGGWNDQREATDFGVCTCSTVGALIYRDAKVVKLAGSIAWGNHHYGDLIAIPMAWVKSIKRLGKVEEW